MNDLTEIGNEVARYALHAARGEAQLCRQVGCHSFSEFQRGSIHGQLLVARYDLGADEVLLQGIKNEVRFLADDYVRRSA